VHAPEDVASEGAAIGSSEPAAFAAVAEAGSAEKEPHASAEKPLALVVEDNADLRSYIASILGRRYRVEVAVDGREGRDKATRLQPEVVVSDVAMPSMDGFELCRELRGNDDTRATPVILVTAYRDLARVLEGFAAGANDFVAKPFHGRELLARVNVHVELRRTLREMAHRKRLATLGVVAASVAHQVRNPLTSLVSGLPVMQKRLGAQLDEASAEMFEVMIDCAARIERMTVDLLDLSRIDREQQATFRPGDGLLAAIRLVSSQLGSKETVDHEVDDQVLMTGRPSDLNHVFLNLVDNARRAIRGGGAVRVQGQREGDEFVVRVEDSGPGIPEAERQRVFDPFFTRRAAGEGTGLGLAIAKQVVDQHGGRIEVGSSDLGGAAFTVRLPVARPGERRVEAARTAAN
jgi:signal transduction histidine kinase